MPEPASAAIATRGMRHGNPAASWLRLPYRWLSPAGAKGRLSILIFHRVREQPNPWSAKSMHARSFRMRMEWVRELCNVLPLEEAVTALARGTLPERAVSITFDDGYADNATVALPILRELGLPATFFIATGFTGGGRMWNDTVVEAVRLAKGPVFDASAADLGVHGIADDASRRKVMGVMIRALKYQPPAERAELVERLAAAAGVPLPDDLMMTETQLRMLANAGMGIGAHTVSHPILASLEGGAARREIAQSREVLEGIIGRRVALFAYPNGGPDRDYRLEHVRIVKELGFDAAVTTAPGAAKQGDPLHELPRFTPWDATPARFSLRMLRNLTVPMRQASR